IVLIELAEDFLLEPWLGRFPAHLITFTSVGVGATILSFIVFRTVRRAEQQLQYQNRELGVLNEISLVVSGSLELDEILQHAIEKVVEITGSETGEIFLADKARSNMVFKIHHGMFSEAFSQGTHVPLTDGFQRQILANREAATIVDLTIDTPLKRKAVLDAGFRAMICAPLWANNRIIGIMNIAHRDKQYSPDELRLLTAIGSQIGLAVENANLYAEVEETLGYLNAVIESSGDAIITSDLKGFIRSWNPGAHDIYGWSPEQALGKYLPMVPEHLMDETRQILEKLRDGNVIHNLETQRLHKSGQLITVMVTASAVRDASGNIIGLAGISKDLSENRRLEAEIAHQRQSVAVLEERERIAREMHDGLAQVLGYVNIKAQAVQKFIQDGKMTEAQTHLSQLQDAARQVYADVREAILGLRSPVSNKQGLGSSIEEYLRNFEEQFGIQAKLILDDPQILDMFTLPVEVQLIRILQEALTNIRKHAQATQVSIRFEPDHHHAKIFIVDDGQGFNPVKPDPSDWPRFGLQTMRERAEGVGGRISFESTPGKGTCVCVILPLQVKEKEGIS
ncbi:MAG: PAS domain S-box protein, partial [Anaerolineae bacterium]|nr:PAS domain S-box protein [Anaerolineae bacterium]